MFRQVSHYSAHLLFDAAGRQMLDGLSVAGCNPNVNIPSEEFRTEKGNTTTEAGNGLEIKPVVADCMTCSCCQTHFSDREEQLGHYKCDWHRYNLHRRLKGLPCISEDAFEEAAGDVSSISGSDDEDERDDTLKGLDKLENETSFIPDVESEGSYISPERKFYKVFFKTKEGELISLFRCLLHHKKNPLYEPDSILAAVNKLPEKNKWIILMVSAGHFVGSVFHGNTVIDHKTFHRYTVRAKRGTAQSTKDGQGGAPKSAGATLRRYNEAALVQDVQDLLSRWEEHVKVCDYIFIRVPVANRGMFFGGKSPALTKDDPRIRVIPFATRRPTFSEAKRVHQMLASVECYGKATEVSDVIPLSPPRIFDSETGQLVLRKDHQSPKSAKAVNKRQPVPQAATEVQEHSFAETLNDADDHDEGIEMSLVETLEEIDLTELKQFDSTVKRRHKKKKIIPVEKQNISKDAYSDKGMARWRNSLFTACKTGCFDSVQMFLENFHNEHSQSEAGCFTNTDEDCTTLQQHSQNSPVNAGSCDQESSISQVAADVCDTSKSDNCIQQTFDSSSLTSESSAKMTPDISTVTDSCVKESSISQVAADVCDTLKSDNCIQQTVDTSSLTSESSAKMTPDISTVTLFAKMTPDVSTVTQFAKMTPDVSTVTDSCVKASSISQASAVDSNILESGNYTQQTAGLSSPITESSVNVTSDSTAVAHFLNMPVSDDGTTFLHVAAQEGHPDIVTALLSSGADPAVKNKTGKTPYNLGEAEVRNAFRRYMAKFPDQYDYSKAQIPSPLTAEMEAEKKQKAAEKKKAKKKASLERNKEKKEVEAKTRAENEEKQRFLALSDREKRALAAEKRILQQFDSKQLSKPVLSRCWQCGTDITGKVPFEYGDYKFCTTKCLREHRSKSSASK